MSSNESQNTSGPQKPKWLTATLIVALAVIVGSGVFLLRSKKSTSPEQETASATGARPSEPAQSSSQSTLTSQTSPGSQPSEGTNSAANQPSSSGTGTGAAVGAGATTVVGAVAPTTAGNAGTPDAKTPTGSTAAPNALVGAKEGGAAALGKVSPSIPLPGAGAIAIPPVVGGIGGVKTPGLAGDSKTNSLAMAPTAPQTAEQVPPAPTEGCVTVSYRHKKTSGHSSEESCLNHKNLLKLKHVNANSICVRVNKTPVAFEKVAGKSDEILVAPGAGPHAEITVRYCFGKKTCPENCTIPKDDFMGSIGATAQNDEGTAQWDPTEKADPAKPKLNVHAKIDSDLKKDLEALDESDSATVSTFKDWIANEENPACGTKQAMR